MQTMFITREYGKRPQDVVGVPEKLEMEGSDLVLEADIHDEDMAKLAELGHMGYGISGVIHEKHVRDDGIEVFDKIDIRSVGIFPKEKLVKPAYNCATCHDPGAVRWSSNTREFDVEEWITVPGRGLIAAVREPSHGFFKVGMEVTLGGKDYRVTGVERQGRHPRVGLIVKEKRPDVWSDHT
jgi:hypothetical protein